MKKIIKSSFALFLMLLACLAASAEGIEAELPTVPGTKLTDGTIYTVSNDVEIASNGYVDGLVLPARGTVTLYIPKGVTLSVAGGNRFCGICVPENATLIITGEGTLEAFSGYALIGYNGNDGADADIRNNIRYAGKGGGGGIGGYGAGAAIGGRGGLGGDGGTCATSVTSLPIPSTTSVAVQRGTNGFNGGDGQAMGKVYVMGTVTVEAYRGSLMSVGTYSSVSGKNASLSLSDGKKYFVGGGGAGGTGGSGAVNAYAIGGGGFGGGGGGSGAYGGFAYSTLSMADYNCIGSNGGNGKGSLEGERQTTGSKSGRQTNMMTGGEGSTGGACGNHGGHGTLYKMTAPNNDPDLSIGGNRIPAHTTVYPDLVIATLSLENNGGTGSTSTNAYYGVRMEDVTIPVRDGFRFMGYYDVAEGGNQVFNSLGEAIPSVSTYAHNTTLYARWKDGYSIVEMARLIDHLLTPQSSSKSPALSPEAKDYDYDHDDTLTLDDVTTLENLLLKK